MLRQAKTAACDLTHGARKLQVAIRLWPAEVDNTGSVDPACLRDPECRHSPGNIAIDQLGYRAAGIARGFSDRGTVHDAVAGLVDHADITGVGDDTSADLQPRAALS